MTKSTAAKKPAAKSATAKASAAKTSAAKTTAGKASAAKTTAPKPSTAKTTAAKATAAKPKAPARAKAAPKTAAPKTGAAKPAAKAKAKAPAKRRESAASALDGAAATPRISRARSKRREKLPPDRLALLVEAARKSLEDDKAEDILVLDVSGRADYTDRLIIATGQVERQLQAMAVHLDEALGKAGLHLKRDAVQASPDWVLIDAGDLVIHLCRPEARQLYRLERMWGPESPERDSLVAEPASAARE